jgi:hypothetical protein
VWEDFYFEFPYLGATGLTDKNKSKIKYPCIAQNKEDGLFCNAVVEYFDNKIDYISRQGKPLSLGIILNNDLYRLASNFERLLDSEYNIHDNRAVVGIYNAIARGEL